MKLIDKILIRHDKIISIKSKRGKDEKGSTLLFSKKISYATRILNSIEENETNNSLIIEARKNFIINSVTALEIYLKEAILTSDFILNEERCEELLKDKISLFEA